MFCSNNLSRFLWYAKCMAENDGVKSREREYEFTMFDALMNLEKVFTGLRGEWFAARVTQKERIPMCEMFSNTTMQQSQKRSFE